MIPEEATPAPKRKSRDDPSEESPGERKKRASHACDSCRVKKVKCNEERPCTNCVRKGPLGTPFADGKDKIWRVGMREIRCWI